MTVEPLTPAPETYQSPQHGWTCFHCGETFMVPGLAEEHFGRYPDETPACRIKAGHERNLVFALREAERELGRYRVEDSDKDREFHRMRDEHGRALRREEEKGYVRGLHDQRQRCLRIAATVKAGLQNGGARNACDQIASNIENPDHD